MTWAPDVAMATMWGAGLDPLEPYARSHDPWLCRCMECGRTVTPTHNNIRRGQSGCSACARAKSVLRGEDHYAYRGDDVSYNGMHRRLRSMRGPASTHECIDCGQQAKDWSYKGGCPKERTDVVDGYTLRYSPDLDMYQPRCAACHGQYDRKKAA